MSRRIFPSMSSSATRKTYYDDSDNEDLPDDLWDTKRPNLRIFGEPTQRRLRLPNSKGKEVVRTAREETEGTLLKYKPPVSQLPSSVRTTYPSQSSSVRGEYPSQSSSVRTTYPSQSSSVRGEYPSQSSSVRTTYPSQSSTVRGEYPSQSSTVRGQYPSQSSSVRTTYPSQSSTVRGEYPSTVRTTYPTQSSSVRGEYPAQSSTVRTTYPTQSSSVRTTQSSSVRTTYPTQSSIFTTVNKRRVTQFGKKEYDELYDDKASDSLRVDIIEHLYEYYRALMKAKPRVYRTLTKPEFALEFGNDKYEDVKAINAFIIDLSNSAPKKASEYDVVDYYINFLEIFNKEIAYDLGLDEEMIEYELESDEEDNLIEEDLSIDKSTKYIKTSYSSFSNILEVLDLPRDHYNEFMTRIKLSLDGDGNISMSLEDLDRLSTLVGLTNEQKELLEAMTIDIAK